MQHYRILNDEKVTFHCREMHDQFFYKQDTSHLVHKEMMSKCRNVFYKYILISMISHDFSLWLFQLLESQMQYFPWDAETSIRFLTACNGVTKNLLHLTLIHFKIIISLWVGIQQWFHILLYNSKLTLYDQVILLLQS